MRYEYEPEEMERDLRRRLTPKELAQLSTQLQGAIAAIDLLRAKAPHVVDAFFARMDLVSTENVSDQAKHALEALANELRAVQQEEPPTPIPSRQALRLAYSER